MKFTSSFILIISVLAYAQPCLALDNETIGIIVGCCCGAVVLVVGVVILYCCCSKCKSKSKEGIKSNGDTHYVYNMNEKANGLQSTAHDNKGYAASKNVHPIFNLPMSNFSGEKHQIVAAFQNPEVTLTDSQNKISLNSNIKDDKQLPNKNTLGLIRTLSMNNFKSDSNFILKTPQQAFEESNSASKTRMYFSSDNIWTSSQQTRHSNTYQQFPGEKFNEDEKSGKTEYIKQPIKTEENSTECVIGDEIFTENTNSSLIKNHVAASHRSTFAESTPFSKWRDRIHSSSSADQENRSISSEVFNLQGHTLADKAFDFLDDYQLKGEDHLAY